MIPLATTRIQVLRAPAAADVDAEHRDPDTQAVAVGQPVRAHIGSPTGNIRFDPSGSSSSSQYKLLADPCDIQGGDTVRDTDGQLYSVDWVVPRRGPLAHVVGGLSETDRLT